MKLIDSFGRIHDYIRISLIDKCNLNCIYCNPVKSFNTSLTKKDILSYEELIRLITILVKDLEVKKIRFTGGEPLIRKDIIKFFEMLSSLKNEYPFEVGITTNGTCLEDKIESLYRCGLDSLNISLDTLNRQKFIAITGSDMFESTLHSIQKAINTGFKRVKINSVIIRNINDDELIDFIDYFKDTDINIRFIEYMPFSGNNWDNEKFLPWQEMKSRIEAKYKLVSVVQDGKIAKDFVVEGVDCKVGFISSVSNHFCDSCNRLRITASGKIKLCLFSSVEEIDLKDMLNNNFVDDEQIARTISYSLKKKWYKHPEAEELAEMNYNNMMSIGG
ncbi:MAG: GTP 3',8-cyclase [Ignavibacteriaceae bacterium]|nr:GTP 3',8-cyclase [Ignavibacteriaceae bacterium]